LAANAFVVVVVDNARVAQTFAKERNKTKQQQKTQQNSCF